VNTPNDLFAAAVAELADLDARLAEMADIQRRRAALADWVATGKRLLSTSAPGSPQAQPMLDASPVPAGSPQSHLTKKAVIAEGVAKLLSEKGRPMQTRELVGGLEAMGIEVGGANKVDTVSVVLTRSGGRFKSLGKKIGWSLVAEPDEATPPSAPTLAGS
jgi:hypothetical protein